MGFKINQVIILKTCHIWFTHKYIYKLLSTYQSVILKSLQAKQINKHKNCLFNFCHVIKCSSIVTEAEKVTINQRNHHWKFKWLENS